MPDFDDDEAEPASTPPEAPHLTALRLLTDLSDAIDRGRDPTAREFLLDGMEVAVRLAAEGLPPRCHIADVKVSLQ